jgi:hypothetical protein
MLTLLFVRHDSEDCSRSLAPVPSASDRLLVGRCSKATELLFSGGPVDAIVIHQDHLQHGCNVVAELKRVAPRTPVILLRDQSQQKEMKPPGISAVCCVDQGDEELVKSLWRFFRLILGKQAERRQRHTIPCALERRLNNHWLWLNAE